jgi:hypothetical protein
MKIGDTVTLRRHFWATGFTMVAAGEICTIIDIVTHTETYRSYGCKNYIVSTSSGERLRCWQGDLTMIGDE